MTPLDTWPSLDEAMRLPVIRRAGDMPEPTERYWCRCCGVAEVPEKRGLCGRCRGEKRDGG